MIVDAHCHSWRTWPYEQNLLEDGPVVGVDGLRREMAVNSVTHALLVAANIDSSTTPNNEFVLDLARQQPDTFSACVDIDSYWSSQYHTPGSAARLATVLSRGPVRAVTHYLRGSDDEWFSSVEGERLLGVIEKHRLPLSLHVPPGWIRQIRHVADSHPVISFLIHHLGMVTATDESDIEDVAELALVPNIYLKYSGPYYAARHSEAIPFSSTRDARQSLIEAYGPSRLIWGSDYPICLNRATYRHALDLCRDDLRSFTEAETDRVLGGNLATLLGL